MGPLVSNEWPTVMLLYVLSQYSCKEEAQRGAERILFNTLDQAPEYSNLSADTTHCCS